MRDRQAFQLALRARLSGQAGTLLDAALALRADEIGAGWRCFHAREVWFETQLPAPLLNDLGREYLRERFKTDLHRSTYSAHVHHIDEIPSGYKSAFLRQFRSDPALWKGYRNFLDVGRLEVDWMNPGETPTPFDAVANEVTLRLLLHENRHYRFEIEANAAEWLFEVNQRATLTPPYQVFQVDWPAPVRDPDRPLAFDMNYWSARYRSARCFGDEPGGLLSPALTLRLMETLAPDFPYSAQHSTRQRMVFMQEGEGALAWAILVEKIAGAPNYRFPPPLILVERHAKHKLKPGGALFHDVLPMGRGAPTDASPRGVELQLRYLLPRYRSLIALYAPYLAGALRDIEPS